MDRSLERLRKVACVSVLPVLALLATDRALADTARTTLRQTAREALYYSYPARAAVAEFFVSQQRMPTSSKEAGLEGALSSERFEVSIVSAGVIALALAASGSGPRVHVFLIPGVTTSALVWKCVSNDIPEVADLVPSCTFDPGYVPTFETPESLEAKANPGLLILNIDGQRFRLYPEGVMSRSTSGVVNAPEFEKLSETGREQLITTMLDRVASELDSLDRVLSVASWLEAMGPSARPILEQRIVGEPSTGAAALLALCRVVPIPTQTGEANSCAATASTRAPEVVKRLNELAGRQLRDPYDHPIYGSRAFDCSGATTVLAALGPAARPGASALGPLLDDPRTELWPGGRNDCKRRDVAVTLLRNLLATPPDTTNSELIDAAVATLARIVMFGPVDRDAKPAKLGALLDARTELREHFSRRIAVLANGWAARECSSISYETPALITDLGMLGFDALQPLLDRTADSTDECSNSHGGIELRALAALLAAYPGQATNRYRMAHSGYARDAFINAALDIVRETDDSRTKTLLDRFLVEVRYAPIHVVPFAVSFPGNPELRWMPYPNWTIPFAKGTPPKDLRTAYREFAERWPDCAIPADDESAWRSVERAKRLFVFPCGSDEPSMVVIGSPEGFKRMQLPERLAGLRLDKDAIAGVSDVDNDGNLEVLVVMHCDGREPGCADGDIPDTYEFVEEDGDRFSHFRVGP